MRKLLIIWCFFYLSANAAINDISHHSRSNCFGFFESISWDGTKPHYFQVVSDHYSGDKMMHSADYFSGYSRRGASYHQNDRIDLVDEIDNVQGRHAISEDGNSWNQLITYASDCNIYDGWYDYPGIGDILQPPGGDINIPGGDEESIPTGGSTDITGVVDIIIAITKAIWGYIFG